MSRRLLLGTAVLTPGLGGIARVARMMADSAVQAGLDLRLLSFLDETPIEVAGARAVACGGNRLSFLLRCHAEALRADYALYDSVGIARAHPRVPGLRRPYGVFIHGIEVWEALRPRDHRTLTDADLVLVNSQSTLRRFERLHGPLPQARVCELATEEDDGPPPRRAPYGPPTVLILGRIELDESYKGHDELIVGWPEVVAAAPGARLIIAGGGTGLGRVRELAGRSPVAASIEVLGFVPEQAIEGLWRRASVFAMPSRGEGFGLVYVEAMRRGVPVVASVHDAGGEVNLDGETGFNVDLDRPGELTGKLVMLLTQPDLVHRMGMAGQARWREHYRASAFRGRFQALLREALERN